MYEEGESEKLYCIVNEDSEETVGINKLRSPKRRGTELLQIAVVLVTRCSTMYYLTTIYSDLRISTDMMEDYISQVEEVSLFSRPFSMINYSCL